MSDFRPGGCPEHSILGDISSLVAQDLPTTSKRHRLFGAYHAPSGSYPGLPWRVRDVSRLGAHPGQASAVRSNRSENNRRRPVRSEGQLSRKSSKRVQTGEPIGISRPPAIRLISLRAFQTFLRDWPHFGVTPAGTRTLYPASIPQTNRRWPTMSANFRMGEQRDGRGQRQDHGYVVSPDAKSML